MRIFEGANDVLLVHAGAIEMKAHRERPALEGQVRPALAAVAAAADRLDTSLRDLRDELIAAHGVRLFGMQPQLHRLGRMATLCEAADAAVLRAEAEGDERSLALAAHFLHVAEERASVALCPALPTAPLAELTDALYAEVSR
jgi:alkylation response protein AidB-like acyl-CoA dehydrogenase